MCTQYVKTRTKNSNGVKFCYVPCGKCADCRKKMQNAWMFRMNSEFLYLKKQGWNVAFCTLTYSEDNLPHVPEECFKDPTQYKEIACFSRTHIREWIDSIRHYCKRHYRMVKGNNIRYFIASEYGEESHRPHYHAIIAWPPICDYQTMHALCMHYWSHGMMFPQNYLGDVAHKCMSFEVVGDATKVLSYCSKYVCKDLAYLEETDGIEFYSFKDYEEGTDEYAYGKMYQDTLPCHIQSKSLGFEPFKLMTDEEKLKVYMDGHAFIGQNELHELPVYIKNKLVFDPYYIEDEETGERLCRRQASAFFEKYREFIFAKKAKFAADRLVQVDRAFLERSGIEPEVANKLNFSINYYKDQIVSLFGPEAMANIGQYYLAYFGVQIDHRYNIPLVEQWMLRYRHPDDVASAYAVEQWPEADSYKLSYFDCFWNIINTAYTYIDCVHADEKIERERLLAKIQDFFNNISNY